jgi:prevent-host-death family protein
MKQVKLKKTSSAQPEEYIDRCITQGPQLIKRNGKPIAVLVSIAQWQPILRARQQTLKELLLSDDNRGEIVIPKRGKFLTRRNINFF